MQKKMASKVMDIDIVNREEEEWLFGNNKSNTKIDIIADHLTLSTCEMRC